ncbi:MAG: FG-GAP-like repeat-containing protein [Verrucomicrobiales bacterium]
MTQLDDPASDGWDSEVTARRALDRLNRLVAETESESSASEVLDPRFHGTRLRPDGVSLRFDDGRFEVQGGTGQSEPLAVGADQFHAAWREMLPKGAEADASGVKVKVLSVNRTGDRSFETRVRIERSGRAARGPLGLTTHWRCEWRQAADEPDPRLVALTMEDFEQVTRAGGLLFADRTEAVLGTEPVWAAQLSRGQPEWLRRLDTGVTRQQFGHHGLAIGDVNGDGLEDVYLCQPAGLPNRLFIHQPDHTVRERAAAAGVDWLEPTMAALLADFDNDGDPDLALAIEQDILFQPNDGRGNFGSPVIAARGHNFISLAAADFDNDGDLDLYAAAYYPESQSPGRVAVPAPLHDAQNGGRNVLLRNDSKAETLAFTDVTAAAGLDANNSRWSFGAAWADIDDDGDPDLAVANDFGRINLFRNSAGHFADAASEIGLASSAFGMSAAWGDVDRDGHFDLYIGGMFTAAGSRIVPQAGFLARESGRRRDAFQVMTTGNALFRNKGDGSFSDISAASRTQMGRWAWAAPFADLNNDGWEDLLVTNGWLTNDRSDDL